MSLIGYTSAPLAFVVDVDIDPFSGVTTFVGGTARADALAASGGAIVAGSAQIISSNEVLVVFAAGVLPVGQYSVQTHVTPLGFRAQIVSDEATTIKRGAF